MKKQALEDPSRSGVVEPLVRVAGVTKRFVRASGEEVLAADSIDLRVEPGEFVILLGPSGCGKTTLLRCIAGLELPDSGLIEIGGSPVYSSDMDTLVPPERRPLNMMFQTYALWPHMTAFDNVAYPLRSLGKPRNEVEERVGQVLRLVGLEGIESQHPAQLSGGQQQRVALARAVVAGDDLILFDEPLSNVDARVRTQLRLELLNMQRLMGFGAVYVTHDQDEAMRMADKIVVMDRGQVAQIGPPIEVYKRPTSRYVAGFIGNVNQLEARATTKEWDVGSALFTTELGTLSVRGESVTDDWRGCSGTIVFRPEDCELSVDIPESSNRWGGTIDEVMYVGPYTELVLTVENSHQLSAWMPGRTEFAQGKKIWLSVQESSVVFIPD